MPNQITSSLARTATARVSLLHKVSLACDVSISLSLSLDSGTMCCSAGGYARELHCEMAAGLMAASACGCGGLVSLEAVSLKCSTKPTFSTVRQLSVTYSRLSATSAQDSWLHSLAMEKGIRFFYCSVSLGRLRQNYSLFVFTLLPEV